MRIEYDLTAEDWAAFGEYCARTTPEFRRAAQVGAAAGVVAILLVFGFVWQRSEALWVFVAGVAAAFAWGLYWPRQLVSHAREHMRDRQRPCLTGLHVMEATPEALFAKCEVTESSIRWSGISQIAETPGHVFVLLSSAQGYVIPRERIRAGDLDQFVEDASRLSRR